MIWYPFGTDINEKKEGPPGPPGSGFKLTDDGDYDMERKILKNLKDPFELSDSATKGYVDVVKNDLKTKIVNLSDSSLILSEKGEFDAKNKRITNLSNPIDKTDVVTKNYLEKKVKINNKKMDNLLTRDSDGFYVPSLMKNGEYNFENTRLSMIGHPILNKDAATKEYVDSQDFYATIQERYAEYKNGGFREVLFNKMSSRLLDTNLKLMNSMHMKITIYLSSDSYIGNPLIKLEIGNIVVLQRSLPLNSESATIFAQGSRNNTIKLFISPDANSIRVKPYIHIEKIDFI